ncbi:hypothetical protein PANI_CDS0128 [Maribacter phage Panino]
MSEELNKREESKRLITNTRDTLKAAVDAKREIEALDWDYNFEGDEELEELARESQVLMEELWD